MSKPTIEQIEKCAEWWAVRTFDKAMNQNNGDDSAAGGFAFLLMNMGSMEAQNSATPDARNKFKQSIIDQLTADPATYLYVDYHPSEPLVKACEAAGISTRMVPIKTFTKWTSGVSVFRGRYQYGGPFEDIA